MEFKGQNSEPKTRGGTVSELTNATNPKKYLFAAAAFVVLFVASVPFQPLVFVLAALVGWLTYDAYRTSNPAWKWLAATSASTVVAAVTAFLMRAAYANYSYTPMPGVNPDPSASAGGYVTVFTLAVLAAVVTFVVGTMKAHKHSSRQATA